MDNKEESTLRSVIKMIGSQPWTTLVSMVASLPEHHLNQDDGAFLKSEAKRLSSLAMLVVPNSEDEYDVKLLMISLISAVISKLPINEIQVWADSYSPHPNINTTGWGLA